ncbi:hypothetical protein PybrP1_006750 [[Pythium] brassicae (nom. inval.)]|nr:hypothetical protein PybrP1_006750 [[Pythium] brassicae (nom. inval.)]
MWWWGSCAGAACCSDAVVQPLRETRAQLYDDLRPLQLERTSSSLLSGANGDDDVTTLTASRTAFLRPGLYTARHRRSQELVALKVYRKALLTHRDARRRLRREVRVLSLCRGHPHLLTLFGVYSTRDTFEIAFELARGGEVLHRIQALHAAAPTPPPTPSGTRVSAPRYVFSEREVSRVVAGVVDGLRFLHAREIVHGEVRPEHLLYSDTEPDARALLAGFGRAALWTTGAFTLRSRRRARPGEPPQFLWDDAHHIRFLPPFALRRRDDALRSWHEAQQIDTWALGVTVYALLCASLPFGGDDALARTVQFPDDGATISRAARDLLQRLLVKDPEDALTLEQVSAHPWVRDGVASDEPWPADRVDEHRAFASAYADEVASVDRRRRVSAATYLDSLRDRPPVLHDSRSSTSRDERRDAFFPELRAPSGDSDAYNDDAYDDAYDDDDDDAAAGQERPSFVSTNGDTQQSIQLRAEDEPPSADGYMRMASEEIDACAATGSESPQVAAGAGPAPRGGYRKLPSADSKLWRVLTKQRRFFSFRSASSSGSSLTKSDSDV